MYAEDLDLGWRLHAAGWRTIYEPRAIVRHEVAAATKQAFGDTRDARHVMAAYAWMLRERGVAVTRAYAFINWLGSLIRGAALALPAQIAPRRYAQARHRERHYAALHRRGLRATAAFGRGDAWD
jgi:GT2 family glycosyltransferase